MDLILTFQHRAIHRLASGFPHIISEAIGTDSWLHSWNHLASPALQTQHVLELLRQNVHDDGGFLDVFYYPIRPSMAASPRYYLLFASRHYDAFELWNDQVAREETTLTKRTYEALLGQTSFFPEFDAEMVASNLLNEVRAISHYKKRFTRKEIVMDLVRNRWGQYHTSDMKKTVRSMVASGELNRENRPGRKIDEDYMFLGR